MVVSFAYAFLASAVAAALLSRTIVAGAALLLALVAGAAAGVLSGPAFVGIFLLGLSVAAPRRWPASRPVAMAGAVLFFAVSFTFFAHRWPGFRNLLVYDHARFSPDAIPFTMYLNFDKALVGLAWLLACAPGRPRLNLQKTLAVVSASCLAAVALLLGAALSCGYVRWDPKLPAGAIVWLLNNFLFVCAAEEALARGFVQGGLRAYLPAGKLGAGIAITGGAVFFGGLHYAGGAAYVLLATLAGLCYGYAYERTGRLSAAMLVHVGVNAVHFFGWSYPALVR